MTIRPYYPASGKARIAFVGGAPSFDDDTTGVPFSGSVGRIFHAILRAAGIDRHEVILTNVFDEEMSSDDAIQAYRDPERRHKARERLNAELKDRGINVVVPLGPVALAAFTDHGEVGKFRGAVTPAVHVLPGAKLLPSVHPEQVMKVWKLLVTVVQDFGKAAAQSDSPLIRYPKRRLLIEPTIKDIEDYLPKLYASELLSTDIETGWGQITCIGFAPDATQAICIPFVDRRSPSRSYWRSAADEVKVWRMVADVLESPSVPILGQNFTYDMAWLYGWAKIKVRNYRDDTRLIHHILYPELDKDLATMSASYTEVGAYKHYGGSYQQEKRDA